MKKFFFFAAALFAAVSFAACSDDDDEKNAGGGAGGNGSSSYYVSRIDFGDPYYKYAVDYEYDEQNRLIKIIKDADTVSFRYVGNQVICEGADSDDYYTFRLDDKGYAVERKDWETFEYDSDGYLLKIRPKYSDSSHDTTDYTWKDGDMIEMQRSNSFEVLTFTYYDEINKINFDPSYKAMNRYGDMFLGTAVPYFAGRKSKHLLKSISDDNGDISTFKYELDSKGRPTTIHEVHKGVYSTYEYNYTLSYK